MSRQISPFAALTGAERQIKWLEYQSIRLPYVQGNVDEAARKVEQNTSVEQNISVELPQRVKPVFDRPQPPPEVPRIMPKSEFQKTHHSQYDAVVARMKQAELQSRQYPVLSQAPKQF